MADGPHGGRVTVAIVAGWPGVSPDEHAANVALMSAAPDLLAALENLLSRASLPKDTPKNAVIRERMISAREQARAAIAKAQGGVQ